jgi:hypothetical protein
VQQDAGSGAALPPAERPVSDDCVLFAPIVVSPSAEVNGALCYGLAIGSSTALQCATSASTGLVECVDALIGARYFVRWSGRGATVQTGFAGEAIGTLSLLGGDRFEVTAKVGLEGICRLTANPASAQFCLYE